MIAPAGLVPAGVFSCEEWMSKARGVKLYFLIGNFVYMCRREARKCGGLDFKTERRQEVSYEEEN